MHQIKLKNPINILTAQNADNFYRIILDAIENAIRTAHAPPVSGADIIHGRIKQRVSRNLLEAIKQRIKIAVGLIAVGLGFTKLAQSEIIDAP